MAYLIDIEGIDGSGKGTQSRLLCERFHREGKKAELISFPRYEATLFGRAVGEFLDGQFGSLEQVHPFLVSLLFAGDRLESKPLLQKALESNDVVVLDRYVPSNVAHQASKREGEARAELTRRILQIEYEIHALPRPDLVLVLDLPAEVAQALVARKSARPYTVRHADIQEADTAYLRKVREVYRDLAAAEPQWHRIDCAPEQRLRTPESIAEEIWHLCSSGFPA